MPFCSTGERWRRAAAGCTLLGWAGILLRGAGQVMFQDSAWTGTFFLAGIACGAWRSGMPEMFFGALLGLAAGTLAAFVLGAPRKDIEAGLHGYNGILTGCALPVFFGGGAVVWALIAAGAFFSTVVMLGVSRLLRSWKVSAVTGPFVFVTWTILLASYSFAHIRITGLPHPVLPEQAAGAEPVVAGTSAILAACLNGVSQVFLLEDWAAGLLFLLGLAGSSLPAAVFAWGGSLTAVAVAVFLGADGPSIQAGLFQFSAVLTAVGLGTTFYRPSFRVILYTLLGTVFTVVAQGAMDTALAPLGIPTLTFPFVLAAWLFLLPNVHLMPDSRRSPSD